jgi:glycosyltransferase involved in cell wall biosynthesis
MAELVNDKLNGFLFEPGNVTDLQQKIHLFLQTERQDRNALYENARTTYVQNFSPEKHYQTILTLYETVIAEKRF